MKLKGNLLYIIVYFGLLLSHFFIWKTWVQDNENIFVKYYLFLTLIFIMVLTILSLIKKIYPQYIGFAFMGLMMFKLSIIFLIMNKLKLTSVPDYKLHFIPPYLVSLLIETFYAISLLKDEKNN